MPSSPTWKNAFMCFMIRKSIESSSLDVQKVERTILGGSRRILKPAISMRPFGNAAVISIRGRSFSHGMPLINY